MSLESKAKTTKTIADLCDNCTTFCGDCPNSAKWVSLEEAIKAIFDKNLERFAEIKALEHKIEAFRKYIYIDPNYKHTDKQFLLLLNSVNSKFEELFGDPSDANQPIKEVKK